MFLRNRKLSSESLPIEQSIASASFLNGDYAVITDAQCPAGSIPNDVINGAGRYGGYYLNIDVYSKNSAKKAQSLDNAIPIRRKVGNTYENYRVCPAIDSVVDTGSQAPKTPAATVLDSGEILVASLHREFRPMHPDCNAYDQVQIIKHDTTGNSHVLYTFSESNSARYIQPYSLSIISFSDQSFWVSWTQINLNMGLSAQNCYQDYSFDSAEVVIKSFDNTGKYLSDAAIDPIGTKIPNQVIRQSLILRPHSTANYVTSTNLAAYGIEINSQPTKAAMITYTTNETMVARPCMMLNAQLLCSSSMILNEPLLGSRVVIRSAQFYNYFSVLVFESENAKTKNSQIFIKYYSVDWVNLIAPNVPAMQISMEQYQNRNPAVAISADGHLVTVIWEGCDPRNALSCHLYMQQFKDSAQVLPSASLLEDVYQLSRKFDATDFPLGPQNSLNLISQDTCYILYWRNSFGIHTLTACPKNLLSSANAFSAINNNYLLLAIFGIGLFLITLVGMLIRNKFCSRRTGYETLPDDSATLKNTSVFEIEQQADVDHAHNPSSGRLSSLYTSLFDISNTKQSMCNFVRKICPS